MNNEGKSKQTNDLIDTAIKDVSNEANRNIRYGLLIIFVAILCVLGLVVYAEGPDLITKQVKGLDVEQNGLNINIKWDEMDCDGYDLTISCEGKKTVIPEMEENTYVIDNILLEKTYKISVSGRLKNGRNSRVASQEIITEKLNQKLKINIKEYSGFKKDKFSIEASGKGDVFFSSSNEKIAKVDDKGKVSLLKTGHADIEAAVSGDGIYAPKVQKVRVNVYPETLAKAKKPTVKILSDSRAEIEWKEVDFATQYALMKLNVATGKYEEKYRTEDASTKMEITRDAGNYAIKAIAVIKDKTIEGKVSASAEVKGTTQDAPSYGSNHIIKSLNSSNMNVLKQVNGDGSTNIPQSLSLTKEHYVVSYVNRGGSSGKFISYKKDGTFDFMSSASGMGHANGSTYNPNTNKFYVVKTHKSIRTASCSTYDGTSKDSTGTFTLPRVTSGIAYDESNNKFYLSKGNEIYVCDSNFKVEKFIHKFVRYNHAQDIGAYNGVVFVCTWVSGKTSYIDLYRAEDGKYLGSYNVSIGEIESVVIDDGYMVILMNTIGSSHDYIYKTKERISIPSE